MQADQLTMIIP